MPAANSRLIQLEVVPTRKAGTANGFTIGKWRIRGLNGDGAQLRFESDRDAANWLVAHRPALVHVTYEADLTGLFKVRRQVWRVAYRAKDRDILFEETVVVLPKDRAIQFAKDIIEELSR